MSFFEKHKSLFVLQFSAVLVFMSCALIRSIPISPFDVGVLNFAHTITSEFLTEGMIFISDAFNPYILFLAMAAISSILIFQKKYLLAFYSFITMVCAEVSMLVLKNIFQITRPVEQVISESGWSFPSGHATAVATFFFLISYAIEKKIDKSAIMYLWMLVAFGLVLATGFSRVYLGVHAATDVLAGFALGTFWATLGILLYEHRKHITQ